MHAYDPAVQSKRVINCLLDGDEGDDSARECPLKVCQRAADGISKAGGGPGEGQTVHVSDDNDGGIAGIAVKQLRLDGVLAQVNIVDVDQELEQPLTGSVGLREGRRDVGDRQRHREVAHGGQDRRHPGQFRCHPVTPCSHQNPCRTGSAPIRSRPSSSVEPPVEILLPPPHLGPSSGDQHPPAASDPKPASHHCHFRGAEALSFCCPSTPRR